MAIPLVLSEADTELLERLCTKHSLNMSEVLRKGLRLLSKVDKKIEDGHDLAFVDKDSKIVTKILIGI